MCTYDPSNEIGLETKLNLTEEIFCRKCDSKEPKIVLQKKFPYCRECFLVYFKHKYSSGLGKAKILRNVDKVLLAFSGSFSSVCLLHLIHSNLVEEKKKKTIFDVVLIYIDEQYNENDKERSHALYCLSKLVADYNYRMYYSCLSPFGKDIILVEDPQSLPNQRFENVTSVLNGLTSKTARTDFIEKLRTHILYEAAKKLNCTRIFTAETSDHIAERIISNVVLGRGKALSSDVGFISYVNESIAHVRPLRESSKKEIVFYNVFNNLHSQNFPYIIEDGKFSSIQNLTESFITELKETFPSTVATVSSTGGKISQASTGKKCLLCQSFLNEDRDLTAKEAMKISHHVTTHGPENFDCSAFLPIENGDGHYLDAQNNLPICYSCSILLRESKNKSDLLGLVIPRVEENLRPQMYDEIKDFLL